jgi:hypothetical protein
MSPWALDLSKMVKYQNEKRRQFSKELSGNCYA